MLPHYRPYFTYAHLHQSIHSTPCLLQLQPLGPWSRPHFHHVMNALFIYNAKGDVLMAKMYRDGVKRNVLDVFRIQVISHAARHAQARPPVLTLGSTSFLHLFVNLLYFVAVTRLNQDSFLVLEFLQSLVALIQDLYKAVNEDTITNNFLSIFNLLDQTVDFGFPTLIDHGTRQTKAPSLVSDTYNMAVSWREGNIKYRRNEIFLNVAEKVHATVGPRGELLRLHIDGTITMKSHLSGMPVCRFGFSNELPGAAAVTLDDFKFHKCVDLARYDAEQVICFVPPDGQFQLLTYRVQHASVPFAVYPDWVERGGGATLKVRLLATFAAKIAATDVCLRFPAPAGLAKTALSCLGGKARVGEGAVTWRFNKFYGDQDHVLTVELPAGKKPLLLLTFAVEMYNPSGLAVKYLKVAEKSNYRTVKWVKYMAQAGSFDIRL